jgi:endonuclease/exonuclease/phosphatase family metal-dependent hydrolase
MRYTFALTLVLLLIPPSICAQEQARSANEARGGWEALSFDDLVTLASTGKPDGPLSARLNRLLTTPFIASAASSENESPRPRAVNHLGPVLRVGLWNIERGMNFAQIRTALTDTDEFESLAGNLNYRSALRRERIESQLATLQNVDVLVLNEVDWGMKRTEYRDVAGELAAALDMNYAYGVEFVEVDPVFDLGTERVHLPDAHQDHILEKDLEVDRDRYRGLHGTAILSRYPIRNARILRLPSCYDWFGEEAKQIARIEKGKRWAAHRLFKERIDREVRRGGRMALIAELDMPESPTGTVTMVATHLENHCAPACRGRQIQALLQDIREDKNPLVIAGDLNTTNGNNTPTSVRNEIMSRVTDYQFWISQAVSYFHPLGLYQHALFPIHYFHGYDDPTAFHVPILWSNREQRLFKTLRKFRFTDGSAFDFRGEPERTLNQRGRTLSDSNERARKGFVPTYAFARDYAGLVGRFKLDWILVKPCFADPLQGRREQVFLPYFPQTMRELNESVVDRISDHAPITVDLSLSSSLVQRDSR